MEYVFWRFLNLKSNFLGNSSKTQGESFSNRAKNKMNRTKPKSLNSDHSVTADLANKLINFQFSCWTTRFTNCSLRVIWGQFLFFKILFIWEYLCICTDGFKDWPWRSESLRKHKTLIITRLEFGCSESFMTSNGLKSPLTSMILSIVLNSSHNYYYLLSP